jgi:hypothetical protein
LFPEPVRDSPSASAATAPQAALQLRQVQQQPDAQTQVEFQTELQDAFRQTLRLAVPLVLTMADESVSLPEVSPLVRAAQRTLRQVAEQRPLPQRDPEPAPSEQPTLQPGRSLREQPEPVRQEQQAARLGPLD